LDFIGRRGFCAALVALLLSPMVPVYGTSS
jgi:hypothetical protein